MRSPAHFDARGRKVLGAAFRGIRSKNKETHFQVTPWLNVTPDVQFVRPGNRAIANDAIIYGLRVNMTL
jgi:carbohydrate-selective porin OprB